MAFIQGSNGVDDSLTGGIDSDIIWGLSGNDTIRGNGGNDEIDGGFGIDTIVYSGNKADYDFETVVHAGQWSPPSEFHFTLTSFDSVVNGDGNDEMDDIEYLQFADGTVHWYDMPIYYTAAPNTSSLSFLYYYGGNANDTMIGHAGSDIFLGGGGNDTFDGKEGFDYIEYDTFNSYVTMDNREGGVTVNLGIGQATGVWGTDSFINVEGVVGSFYNDLLIGSANADYLGGNSGDDVLYGAAGNDQLDGGAGLDWAVYFGNYNEYLIENTPNEGERTVYDGVGNDGTDSLIDVERVQFNDLGIAFDTDGNAGDAARLIGVLLGGEFVLDAEIEAIVIEALDGGYTSQEFADIAIDVLYPNYTNAQLADLIYTNVVGVHPSQSDLNAIVAAMNATSAAYVAVYAGDTTYNDANIDFAGLVENGVPFTPFLV